MGTPLRIATFNVENLFSRAVLLNFRDNDKGSVYLDKVAGLERELEKKKYDKKKILALYKEVSKYIEVVETRGKLFDTKKSKVMPDGRDGWDGFISFRRAKFTETARQNAAKVIKEADADVCCLIEVESRPVLKQFCGELLGSGGRFKAYPHVMLIDGNDPRGIDVGVATRLPIKAMRSHVDDEDAFGKTVFSRDCLELELEHPAGFTVNLLVNHLKSKLGAKEKSDARRALQAGRVVEILKGFDLKKDYVVVAGDFNDTPDSEALKPLLSLTDLHDVLKEKVADPAGRWTYHYKDNQQIDYMLVSRPLKERLQEVKVLRRGMYGVEKFSGGKVKAYDTVKKPTDGASDHAAVCASFMI